MNDTMNYIFGSLNNARAFMNRQTKFNLMAETCLLVAIVYLRSQQQKINALQAELEELKQPKEE